MPAWTRATRPSHHESHVHRGGIFPCSPPEKIRSPEIPHFLGWLNYYSSATAQAIGFPAAARVDELVSGARRTATGGWGVRLTDTPLDYDNPVHLAALLRAYERFPEIAGRSAP